MNKQDKTYMHSPYENWSIPCLHKSCSAAQYFNRHDKKAAKASKLLSQHIATANIQ